MGLLRYGTLPSVSKLLMNASLDVVHRSDGQGHTVDHYLLGLPVQVGLPRLPRLLRLQLQPGPARLLHRVHRHDQADLHMHLQVVTYVAANQRCQRG